MTYRQFAQVFLRSMAKADIPVTTAIRELKRYKISYRRTDMLRDYREVKGVVLLTDRYKYIPHKYRIPRGMVIDKSDFIRTRYQFLVKHDCLDRRTGKPVTREFSVSSDYNLSREAAEQRAADEHLSSLEAENLELKQSTLIGAYHQKGELW